MIGAKITLQKPGKPWMRGYTCEMKINRNGDMRTVLLTEDMIRQLKEQLKRF